MRADELADALRHALKARTLPPAPFGGGGLGLTEHDLAQVVIESDWFAARVAEARADERERIAQAIEDDSHVAMSIRRPEPWQHATRRAARIAREGADR